MNRFVVSAVVIVWMGCDGGLSSETAGAHSSALATKPRATTPSGFPAGHAFCADNSFIQFSAFPDGRLYVDGYMATWPRYSTSPETRYYFYGEPVMTEEVAQSGFNLLPFSPPHKSVSLKLKNAWCETADGSKSCQFDNDEIILTTDHRGAMSVRTPTSLDRDVTVRSNYSISRCGNNQEDSGRGVTLANGFSWKPNQAAPNMIVSLFGKNLAAGSESAQSENGQLPTRLSDVEVRVDDVPAQLFFASADQINLLMPPTLDDSLDVHRVEVRRGPGWLAGKGTFFLDKTALGLHSSAFWTKGSHVSVAVTGVNALSLTQLRFVINGKTYTPSAEDFDWMGDAPGFVGYQQININMKSRLTAEELKQPIRVRLIAAPEETFAESNEVILPPSGD